MPTLYVENVPEELYEALRDRAREHHRSMAAEVITLLEETVPTLDELGRRLGLLKFAHKMSAQRPASRGPFPAAEEMLREDRGR